jgi:tetratricopeptide (TPR) repeat protein
MILGKLGKHEEAIECYDKVIELDPENEAAWINKGNALCNLNKYEEGIKCCDKAIKMDPPDSLLKLIKGTIERIRQSMDEREISDK